MLTIRHLPPRRNDTISTPPRRNDHRCPAAPETHNLRRHPPLRRAETTLAQLPFALAEHEYTILINDNINND